MAGMAHQVSVFFYGSYINPDVLAESGLRPERFDVARLPGFDIVIDPYANIVRDERAVVTASSHLRPTPNSPSCMSGTPRTSSECVRRRVVRR
jgi:hypothetical protein